MRGSGDGKSWRLADEINYINELVSGEYLDKCPHKCEAPVVDLLRNYVRSAERRLLWGTYVNGGAEAIKHARKQLSSLWANTKSQLR